MNESNPLLTPVASVPIPANAWNLKISDGFAMIGSSKTSKAP